MNNFGLKDVLKRFGPYFKDYIPHFIFAIIGMGLASGGTAVSAYLVEPVLNKIFVEKNEKLLYILPCAIIAIYVIKNIGTFMQAYFTAYIGQDTIRRFREKMVANLLNLDMDFFNEFRTGELISRTTNDIDRIRSIVSSMIPELTREFITIIGLLCVVVYQSPKLAFFALVVMPVAIYPISRLAKRMKKISKQSQEKTSDITSALSEIFTNIEIIKANNAQEYEHSRFVDENNKFFRLNLKSVKIEQLVSPLMETIGSIGVAAVIIIGGKDVIDGHINMGAFFSFLTALFMLYTPLKRIVNIYNRMQDAIAASERTFFLMDKVSQIKDGQKELNEEINLIKFNDVRLSYGDKEVLKGINLEANKSEFIALVGSSGGGKSSLMNLLMRFYDVNGGEILINGINLKDIKIHSLRQNIGLVTQRVYIFNDTVAKNVAYGREFNEDAVINALKLANAYEFVSKLDNGINTILNEFGTNLSGGQRQRIAIARALYQNPQILIFDEATSALDNESEKEITKAINNLRSKKIIFVIAHRLSTVENADKIAVLSDGKIIDSGSDEELSKRNEIYARLKGKALV
ncbi:ABC transporter ATP-binding protein/permease [Campylobacter concisus]|uniref:ABC transporter ATP-binding protein n=1 Tax=Campylobacter concisus TaxID=199 RepID=UPI001CE4309C|nr:ABC transporter ATP-binding protein [Campylobacter concisus]MCA6130749.1 ABC transporter ATP-binding protein/permease [Campylobacter concisus]MCA6132531.1 ABC transporter ATP-binding protein/permease [Campylobacter concisus]